MIPARRRPARRKTDRSRSKKAGSIPFFTDFCSVTMGGKPFSRPTRHGQLYDPPPHIGDLCRRLTCVPTLYSRSILGAAKQNKVRPAHATATLSRSYGMVLRPRVHCHRAEESCGTEWFIGKQSSKPVTARPCDHVATGTAPHGEKKTKENKNETCSR